METFVLILEDQSIVVQYITSFYWAISTMCSVGYGDLHAVVMKEVTLFVLFSFWNWLNQRQTLASLVFL